MITLMDRIALWWAHWKYQRKQKRMEEQVRKRAHPNGPWD